MPTDLSELIDRIRRHPRLVVADDFEISVERETEDRHRFLQGQLEHQTLQEDVRVRLRLLHRKRSGVAVTSRFEKESLEALVDEAFTSAVLSSPDPWFRFPIWRALPEDVHISPSEKPSSVHQQLSSCPAYFEEDHSHYQVERELFRKTEKNRLRSLRSSRSVQCTVWDTIDGRPIRFSETRENFRGLEDSLLQNLEMAKSAESFGAPSGKMNLILVPAVATRLLAESLPWVLADRAGYGDGPFFGQVGKKVVSDHLTWIDEGQRNAAFDAEGVPTQRTTILEKGVLQTFLHSTYSATRENCRATGNFLSGRYMSLPRISASVFSIQPGAWTQEKLIELARTGIQLTALQFCQRDERDQLELVGSGWYFTQGQRVKAVCDVRLVFGLKELWNAAAAIGNDIEFFDHFGSPSIFFEKIPLSK